MYSHELQTCDWPRNVGCGASENSDSGTVSTIRVTDPRTRAPQHSRAPVSQQQNTAAPQIARNANRQEYIRQRQPEVIQQQLYTEEDLGPAEEIESDRQQRVYRGQPSTIGQVQRDRDGLRTIKSGVHSQNVIPTGPDTQEKISVVSYSNQRQPRPQDQYRVDQVQGFQVTSSLPPLTPTPRTIERYNTSQRYQPNQYDQYYTVYDEDADLYRGNDYPQQEYNTPSSTPSSNIVHQYRGQTTFKQQQQAIELEQQREPIQQRHQQPLRNSYNQDVYSPPPVVQDYNDQYSSQIDDQQYQHLVASTPKAPNRSVSTNSSKDTFPQSSITVSRISDNTTSKPETINRRSDSNSFFEPSAILIPPPRVAQGFQRPSPSTPKYSYTTEGYRTISPSTQRSAEPPRNGGALAKTLNNFDSLLTSFFSAVSGKQSSPPKSAPETIVRSEIGRIHHDPIIITDDYRNRETFKPEGITPPPPPPSPNKNDYLAYFVEIEPKKAKTPEIVPSFVVAKPESVTDSPKIITKDALADGQSDVVNFNLRNRGRPFNSFVRIVPNGEEHQNIQLGASLDIEPILKPTTPQPPKIEPEVLPIRREPPRPAVVIPENPPTAEFRPQPPAEIPTERPRIRGNTFFRPRPAQELQPKLIENANPYKFVVVDAEKTVEKQPSSPAPFSRNPENEERNQFEVRNRFRFRTPDAVVPDREPKRFEIPPSRT
ncbi:UNVERIFIED_CONTAM: hypothetical protein PYX00_010393 [Menopon gallinae]|uniref:Uncharacterized protein n=1 Tax=Menopon gallinae TaxID=328185 RepID=A0AAW2HFA0_9NEOP